MSYREPKLSYWQDAAIPREQLVLFQTTLEERIPNDHPVRLLDEILDQLDWGDWESAYNGARGQPPIHPSIHCKILLYAMSRRIRSSRQMEYALEHSIDFIWLASGRKVDHSTLSDFRRAHESKLKGIYRQMIQLAISLGVAKLSELCIDGTKIQAKLKEALAQLESMEEQRRRDGIDNQKNPAQLPMNDFDSRILPNKEGGYAPNYTPMAVTETANGFIVQSDVLIGNVEHTSMFSMIDAAQFDYEVEVKTILADGAYATGPNLAQAEERQIEILSPVKLDKRQVDNPAHREVPTEPVAEADLDRLPINPSTKRFDRTAFVYDAEADCYYCPNGKTLTREGTVEKIVSGGVEMNRKSYRCHDCADCPLMSRCRMKEDSKTGRKVCHDEYEEVRARHTERMQDESSKERYKKRQHFGETQFAFIKTNLGIRRFLLHGHQGARQEWRWSCLTFNLTKLMNLWGSLRAELENAPVATNH